MDKVWRLTCDEVRLNGEKGQVKRALKIDIRSLGCIYNAREDTRGFILRKNSITLDAVCKSHVESKCGVRKRR